MVTSAFKSTSRRGSISNNNSSEKTTTTVPRPLRRSHSVSALSRATEFNIEFSNKRDNPLFWGSPPEIDDSTKSQTERERGRSVTRNSDVVNNNTTNKTTFAKVDTWRRGRSVSRGRNAPSLSSEVEQDSVVSSSNYRNKRGGSSVAANGFTTKDNNNINNSDKNAAHNTPRRKSTDHPSIEPSRNSTAPSSSYLQIPNLEDGISTGSLSEAEERTIKAVCEQMKSFQGDYTVGCDTGASGIYETVRSEVRRAISDIQNDLENAIRRNNTTTITTTNVAEIPPDLVNPGAVELVLDIRREYARKLEESKERARKLRADLSVEEHRVQELTRILKELLPDPKTTNGQKPRPGRKSSSERKKMSKRLTEEAMAYFDECVSISTFDSSDFSAPEDPIFNSTGAVTPVTLNSSTSFCPNNCLNHKQDSGGNGQLMHNGHMDSAFTASSSSNEPVMLNQASLRGNNAECGRKLQFSISKKPTESESVGVGLQQDIRNYMKNIEKEFEKDSNSEQNIKLKYCDLDDYNFIGHNESLFDRVLFKNTIESGCLHLCDGGLVISLSPFSFVN